MIVLLQFFLDSDSEITLENRLIFDEVKAYKMVPILGHPVD